MDSIFQKFWFYLKPHIVSLAFIVTLLVSTYFLFKKERSQFAVERTSYVDKIKALNENHDEIIRKMNASTEEERRQHDEDVKKWKTALEEVQKKYDHDVEELLKKKNDQTKKLMQVYGEDPKGMADQISAITGFKVVDPGSQK